MPVTPTADSREIEARMAAAMRDGRWAEATDQCRALLAIRPDDAVAWYNLGWLLRSQRDFSGANHAYGEAIARGIDRPDEAYTNRAAILLEHLLRPEEAEQELLAALRTNPESLPALLTLAQVHEDLGRVDEAAKTYRRVLEVAPGCGRAHARLAGMAINSGQAAAIIPQLQQAARVLPPASDDFAEVVMALGQAFERQGRYEEAFSAFKMANATARNLVPAGSRYSAGAVERLIDSLIAATPAPSAGASGGTDSPIFVCGMLRSGSTLAERILGQHPRVTAGGEIETIPALAASIEGYPATLASLGAEQLEAMRARYWAEARTSHGAFDLLVDKRPDNFLHIGLIKALFPGARIINTLRDPADTMISIFANLFGPAVPYAHSLSDIRHWQAQHDRLMAHWRALWPDDILTFEYGKLVADPAASVAALLDHCGLEWDDACLALPAEGQSVRTLSQWQVREPIHSRSTARAAPFSRWLHLA